MGGGSSRAAVLWGVVAVLALFGFTAMHGIAVTDASARHVIPAISTADAPRGTTTSAAAHAGGHHDSRAEAPAPSDEHTHDGALLGCLIALTGLALVALAKRPTAWWLWKRSRPLAVLLDGRTPAAPGLPPGFAQLRLGILRI